MSRNYDSLTFVAALLVMAAATTPAPAQTLGDNLRGSGWDRILGTWVHAESGNIEVTYAWKFPDRVIEVRSTMGDREATALIAVNAKTGHLYHVGADNQGGSIKGNWELEDGDAVLDATYITGEGKEQNFTIRHHLADDDTLDVTVDGEQQIELTLTRKKE